MSKEFEEIVLKKLEKLDVLETEICDLKKETKGINQRLDNHEKELKSNKEEFKSIHAELKSTQDSIKKLNDNFTVFDFEINKKIDTLFDAITVNNEKYDLFEKSIISLNTKTFNHDIRISVLEDYNKNDKLFVTN